jgi:hypothetical protein
MDEPDTRRNRDPGTWRNRDPGIRRNRNPGIRGPAGSLPARQEREEENK